MKECSLYQEAMIEHLDGQLGAAATKALLEHLTSCSECRQEYKRLERFYRVMDEDGISLPARGVFLNIQQSIRQQAGVSQRFPLGRLVKVMLPPLAVAALLLVLLNRKEDTIEMSVPVENLIEDGEIAGIAVNGIVDQKLLDDFSILDECLQFL